MRGLRIAALLILAYAVALAVNAGIYVSWSADFRELPRLIIRLGGAILVAYGLWTSARWAWWGGVIFSGLLTALGVLLVYTGVATGFAFLARRPYPAVDVLFFAVSVTTLAAAFVLLLLPSSRQAVATGRRDWRA